MKKAGILALAIYLSLVLLSSGTVQARSRLRVLDILTEVEFPFELSFSMSARSDVDITDIRLHYIVDRISFARTTSEVYIEFVPDTTVDVAWTWDVRKMGGLPPGTGIDYWWTVTDARGDEVETRRTRVWFDDNRYSWRRLKEGDVTIYWYEGGLSFAGELMAAAQQALARLAEDTGAELEKVAQIYIYASAQDLREAMIHPQEWAGGAAFTRYGIIAIGIAPDGLDWGKRAVAHEMAHLVIHQMTFNPYSGLPTWLDEGLAMYAEGVLGGEFIFFLDKAIAEDSLIPVRSLASPFSAYAGQSYLSYAQSYRLVEFLIDNYGQDKMLQLLNSLQQGIGCDTALEKVYGFNMDGLDSLWKGSITDQYHELKVVTTVMRIVVIPPPLIGLLTALAVVVLLVSAIAVERWTWR